MTERSLVRPHYRPKPRQGGVWALPRRPGLLLSYRVRFVPSHASHLTLRRVIGTGLDRNYSRARRDRCSLSSTTRSPIRSLLSTLTTHVTVMALRHIGTGAMRAAVPTFGTRQSHRLGCALLHRSFTITGICCGSWPSRSPPAGKKATGKEQ